MNRLEQFPLTQEMLRIATHPDNPWLQAYCELHNPKPKSSEQENRIVRADPPYDVKNNFIKHLASKVRVE